MISSSRFTIRSSRFTREREIERGGEIEGHKHSREKGKRESQGRQRYRRARGGTGTDGERGDTGTGREGSGGRGGQGSSSFSVHG